MWTNSTQANDSLGLPSFSSTTSRLLTASSCVTSTIPAAMPHDTRVEEGGFVSMIDLLKNVGHSSANQAEVNSGCYTLFGADTSDGQFGKSPPQNELSHPNNSERSYSLWGEPDGEKLNLQAGRDFNFWREKETSGLVDGKTSHTRADLWQWDQHRHVSGELRQQLQLDVSCEDTSVDSWNDMPYYLKSLTNDRSRGYFGSAGTVSLDGRLSYGDLSHVMMQSGSRKNEHRNEKLPVHVASTPSKPQSDQQAKKVSAEQQFFLSELERLPPLLRQQYIDFMIAKQQFGTFATVTYPYVYPMPPLGAICQVELGSLAAPQTFAQSKPVQPVLLVPKPVPPYGMQVPVLTMPQQIQPLVKTMK
jgi:hypothetical protein